MRQKKSYFKWVKLKIRATFRCLHEAIKIKVNIYRVPLSIVISRDSTDFWIPKIRFIIF